MLQRTCVACYVVVCYILRVFSCVQEGGTAVSQLSLLLLYMRPLAGCFEGDVESGGGWQLSRLYRECVACVLS